MITILIVDDHPLIRDALTWTIGEESDFQVIGEASDGQEALEKCIHLQPDLVLLDIYMPVMDGIETIRRSRAAGCKSRFLILTSSMEKDKIISAMQVGADGFMLKNTSRPLIIEGIRTVVQGKMYIHPEITNILADYMQNKGKSIQNLSLREKEIVELIRQSYSNREIAEILVISISTVRVHINNIKHKLMVSSRREIAHFEESHGG